MQTKYQVSGMSCDHCEAAVREEVEAIGGLKVVSVSAPSGELIIESDAILDDSAVLAAVGEAGYSAERSA